VLVGVGIWFSLQGSDSPAEIADASNKPAEVQQKKLAQTANVSKTSQETVGQPPAAKTEAQNLKYGWQNGSQVTYRFEFNIDSAIRPQQFSGSIVYSINKAKNQSLPQLQKNRPVSGDSGTTLPTNPQLVALACSLRIDRDDPNVWRGLPTTFDLVVDDRGEIHPEYEQRGPKPLLFNGIDTLGIEYLAGSGEKKWELKRKFSGLDFWARRMGNNPNSPPGPPFPPGAPGQFQPGPHGPFPAGPQVPGMPPGVSIVDVIDHISYETVEKNEKTLILKKEHTMAKWQSSSSGEPRPFLQGTGTVTYDVVQQLPIASKMTYRAEDHPQLGHTTYVYSYRLETDEEVQQEVQNILKELAGGSDTANTALLRLSKISPIPMLRDEVGKILNQYLLASSDKYAVRTLDAIKKWGTDVNEATLFQLAESKSPSIRSRAMELIGERFKTSETAHKLGESYFDGSIPVEIAWRKIGPPAEDAVLKTWQRALIEVGKNQSKDRIITDLLLLISQIGGKKSIDLLSAYKEEQTSDKNASAYDHAIKKCRERIGEQEKSRQD